MSEKPFFSWRQAILESDLVSTTKLALLALSCHMNSLGQGCFPSTRLLAKETSLSERAVVTHLQIAAEKGWISRKLHGFGGQGWSHYEYEICFPGVTRETESGDDGAPTYESSEEVRAHKVVAGALSRGTLQRQPCEVCGDEKVEAHHDDHSKPLEVRWLCHSDHKKLHRKLEKRAEPRSAGHIEKRAEPRSAGQEKRAERGSEAAERGDIKVLKDVQCSTSINSSRNSSGGKDLVGCMDERAGTPRRKGNPQAASTGNQPRPAADHPLLRSEDLLATQGAIDHALGRFYAGKPEAEAAATPDAARTLLNRCLANRNGHRWGSRELTHLCAYINKTRIPEKTANPIGWLLTVVPKNFFGLAYEAEELGDEVNDAVEKKRTKQAAEQSLVRPEARR